MKSAAAVWDSVKGWFKPLPNHDNEQREMWPSRAGFLLAAIGSSVGLGNIWRFPAVYSPYMNEMNPLIIYLIVGV